MEMEVDRISYLPWNIVDKILSLLTLRDAVRTSILSSQVSGDTSGFKLSTRDACDSDIDRWTHFLSRGYVKEFMLEIFGQRYQLPSSLYLCDKLSHLQLSCCSLKPSSAFNGFKMLTSLDLSNVLMDQDFLENLICRCPLLERLELVRIREFDNLTIRAQKLTFFVFRGVFEDVNFENTVHLSTVAITLYNNIGNNHESLRTTSKLVKLFASLPSIQRLKVHCSFLKFLAADMVPRRLPTPCMELNNLTLVINFNHMDECLAALCILRSSPNLQELKIRVALPPRPRSVTKKYLMEEDYQNIILKKLRYVKIRGFIGVPRVLDFINFLLVSSPMLERMNVGFVPGMFQDISDVELLKKLLRFKRASANAEIIYMDYD